LRIRLRLTIMEKINQILTDSIKWIPDLESNVIFISEKYSKNECYLQMNDFPDEPMWTLFYKGESIDFDNKPKNWKIKYRSQ